MSPRTELPAKPQLKSQANSRDRSLQQVLSRAAATKAQPLLRISLIAEAFSSRPL